MASRFFSKSFHPLKLNFIDSYSKSPFQSFFENALGKTRRLLRVFLGKENNLSDIYRCQHRLPIEFVQKSVTAPVKSKFFVYRPGYIANLASKWAQDSIAGAFTKGWQKKIAQRSGGPMLCFVGVVLAKKPSLLTKEEERESVSFLIRDTFSKISWQHIGLNIDKVHRPNTQLSLSDLKIDSMIAKGCNAAVYSACLQGQSSDADPPNVSFANELPTFKQPIFRMEKAYDDQKDPIQDQSKIEDLHSHPTFKEETLDLMESKHSDTTDENPMLSSKILISHSEGEISLKKLDTDDSIDQNLKLPTGEFYPNNLAVKIMFNYSAESNSYAIWNAMHKEVLPAITGFSFNEQNFKQDRTKGLMPHPNIVEMYFAFADMLPFLPGAHKYFPQALPVRLLNDGCGRNMTLFLVMKRYHCSLKEYLEKINPSSQTSLLLFTQLMEALVHLYQNNIAHRDLKTDNILIDLSQGITSPRLAVTDFGCCLESLTLSYSSNEISKGGNMALMAPEVVNTEAGPLSKIDYSRSDLWTAGTIAYEIFGGKNPFYSQSSNLKNHSYCENNLPPMPAGTPDAVQKLVKHLLYKDPKKRPSQTFAATVCQILLHAPPDMLCNAGDKKVNDKALEWIFVLSAKTYLEGTLESSSPLSLEFVLRHTFCSRIQYLEVASALKYILDS